MPSCSCFIYTSQNNPFKYLFVNREKFLCIFLKNCFSQRLRIGLQPINTHSESCFVQILHRRKNILSQSFQASRGKYFGLLFVDGKKSPPFFTIVDCFFDVGHALLNRFTALSKACETLDKMFHSSCTKLFDWYFELRKA